MKALTFTIALAVAAVLPARAQPGERSSVCKPEILPLDIRNQISTRFPSWRIQEPSDLNPLARGIWKDSAPSGDCPGIAVGQFDGGASSSYAVFLVSTNHPKTGKRFLIFRSTSGQPSHELKLVERDETAEAGNFFVRTIQLAEFFNPQWVQKLGARAKEGILFLDAGEQEYEADVYYWAQGRYRHEPVDY
jgi:hypothetical protein